MAGVPRLQGPRRQNSPQPYDDLVARLAKLRNDLSDLTGSILRSAGIAVSDMLMTITRSLRVEGTFESTSNAKIGGSLDVTADTTLGSSVRVEDVMDVYGRVNVRDGAGFSALYADGALGAKFGPLTLDATGGPDGMGLLIQAPTAAGLADVFRAKYDGSGNKRVLFGETGKPLKDVWGLSETWYFETTSSGTGVNAGMVFQAAGDINFNSGTYTLRIPWFTTSSAANMFIDNDGRIWKSTSARKYKQDIEDAEIDASAVLQMRPRTWRDRAEVDGDPATTTRYVGFIAEELDELGLGQFVTRTPDGAVEGIAYDRLVAAVIPVLKDFDARLKQLESPRSERL